MPTPLWEPPARGRPGELGSRHDATTSTHSRTAGRAREAPGCAEGPIETSDGPQGSGKPSASGPGTQLAAPKGVTELKHSLITTRH